jgi:hypothetical protein
MKVEFSSDSQVRRIGKEAFSDCESIHSIWIPRLVESIAEAAFADSGLCEIEIAESAFPSFRRFSIGICGSIFDSTSRWGIVLTRYVRWWSGKFHVRAGGDEGLGVYEQRSGPERRIPNETAH